MRVNSVFTGVFYNRLKIRSVISVVMLAIFFTASSFAKHSDPDLRAKQVNIIIRQIGHRLLLQAGDSTSRVLPVTEIKDGTFLLRFENQLVFRNDSLMMMSKGLLPRTEFPSGYTVTVHDCLKAGIVYGFQISNTSPDILPCRGRSQPPGCYLIEFTFPDFYENNEDQEKADIKRPIEEPKSSQAEEVKANPVEFKETIVADDGDPLIEKPESFKTARKKTNEKLKQSKKTTADYERLTEEIKTFKIDHPEANPKLEEYNTTSFDYSLINVVYSGMLILLGVTLLITRFGKKMTPLQDQNHAIVKEPVPEFAALGKFLFDAKSRRLLFGNEAISLTDKENKILELLNQSFGELILRETLMQKIWLNEGVITGRSLDMFVSKLRKKLSSDPDLRITNVHGKGYKLEIPPIASR
jgi:hypothetical protein